MSYTTNSLSNYESDAYVPDEREDIEGHACRAANINSRERGGHQLRLFKNAMPNTSFLACREPLANESTVAALEAFDPQDEQERILCFQMLMIHEHMMDCFTRANKDGLDPHLRDQELKHAEKLGAIAIKLSEALDKHRGKGNQKITVERVYGNQAIIGTVNNGSAAGPRKIHDPEGAPQEITDDSFDSADGEKLSEALNTKTSQVRQRTRQQVKR